MGSDCQGPALLFRQAADGHYCLALPWGFVLHLAFAGTPRGDTIMASLKRAEVLVAHAEPVARAGLVHLLAAHPRLHVCAEAEAASQVRPLCDRHHPSVLVFDPGMGDGFSLIKDVRQKNPSTHVVVFSGSDDSVTVQRAFRAGACGFVTRRDPAAALTSTVVAAIDGTRHLGPSSEHQLLDNLARGSVEVSGDDTARLSNRELQVFQLIGRGLTARAVAAELGVSVKTVETHRERIKVKLSLRSCADLQRLALQQAQRPGDGS